MKRLNIVLFFLLLFTIVFATDEIRIVMEYEPSGFGVDLSTSGGILIKGYRPRMSSGIPLIEDPTYAAGFFEADYTGSPSTDKPSAFKYHPESGVEFETQDLIRYTFSPAITGLQWFSTSDPPAPIDEVRGYFQVDKDGPYLVNAYWVPFTDYSSVDVLIDEIEGFAFSDPLPNPLYPLTYGVLDEDKWKSLQEINLPTSGEEPWTSLDENCIPWHIYVILEVWDRGCSGLFEEVSSTYETHTTTFTWPTGVVWDIPDDLLPAIWVI